VHHAATNHPDNIALLFEPSGRRITYGELERGANRAAHALRAAGLRAGELLAIGMPNSFELIQAFLGAARIGAYFTPLPSKGSAADLCYLVRDSEARLLVADQHLSALSGLRPLLRESIPIPLYVHGSAEPADLSWDALVAAQSSDLPADLRPGREMLYSSGSTGRPKGVRKPAFTGAWDAPDPRNVPLARDTALDEDSIFLSTSPLYHSAPLRFLQAALSRGATCIVMEHFEAELALQCIERHRCTHSLWVPTMFHRLLRLEHSVRARYDVCSMREAVHGAAPCSVHVKEAMIDWWGPVLSEYYSGTEGVGSTWITAEEWLQHKGSVGMAATAHILDEEGQELPLGETGTVYFEGAAEFSYWKDSEKTKAASSPQGWRTFGDIGYLDAQRYLYLTDRRDFMLISGGVNIYPQEVESALLEHPLVADVAAFGVPDDDLGESLVAVVQLESGESPAADTAAELQRWCQNRLGRIKTPKKVRFVLRLPRLETGKLHKKRLREAYLEDALESLAPPFREQSSALENGAAASSH